jgi:hypothetical protein
VSLKTLHPSLRAAFRERLLTVVDVDASPGSVTASGGVYARASGSWITDGFRIGQEVQVTGVGSGTVVRVKSLTASTLTTTGTATGSGASPRFLVGLPQGRAWEGQGVYRPTLGQPYISEAYVPANAARITQGSGASPTIQHDINANVTLFYPASEGTEAIERMAGAIQAHFMPKTKLTRDTIGARVMDVRRSPVMMDGDWLSIGVTVQLLAFTIG